MSPWRMKINEIIFGSETRAGKIFDLLLIISIVLSVLLVMADSVRSLNLRYGQWLLYAEWFFTILFSIEYALRLICVSRPWHYARSFYGIIDLLAILPSYLSLLIPGARYFLVLRFLRVLRIFRILKLAKYVSEASFLLGAIRSAKRKIIVFLVDVVILVCILGSFMYIIEGEANGFTSIPRSIYWAIVTLTTVGYGDISPQTNLGQFVAAIIMIMGFAILAVPTGIISAEMTHEMLSKKSNISCPHCGSDGHKQDARFCRICGGELNP